jgi:hypothetical protein
MSDTERMVWTRTTKGHAMCWQCDHPGATTADYLKELRATVREHGWAVQYVESDRKPFAYTVGLHDRGLPELLVTGTSPSWAVEVLNCFAREALDGRDLRPGTRVMHDGEPIVEVVEVEQPDAHVKWAVAFGGRAVRAIQLVSPDDRGRWPWSPDFDDGRGSQPVLGKRGPQNA